MISLLDRLPFYTRERYVVAFLIILTICFRLPGLPWGVTHGDYLEPDEGQHVRIAADFINAIYPNSFHVSVIRPPWNARAFGVQTGLLALVFSKLGFNISYTELVFTGRLLSTAYSALLVALLYIFITRILVNRKAGLIAALLLAVSDLNVTYSHYAVPEISHVFWFMFSVVLLVIYWQKRRDMVIKCLLGASIGMSLAVKFDPSPLLAFGIVLLLQRFRLLRERVADLMTVSILALLVLVTSWACIDPALYSKSFHKLWSQNYHTINKNSHLHLLYNPLLYPAAIVGGTGFPLAVSCLIGLRRCFSAKCGLDRSSLCVILAAPFLLFVIYWSGDATFVRRASAFIPFCALFAGLFIASLRRSSAVAFAIIGYTLLFTAISQYAFIDDTRYQAQRYLNQLRFERDQITVYSKYAKPAVKNSSLAIPMSNASLSSLASYGKVGLVVLHETYYGRYGKSFTTPFRLPKNCDEVYHCKPKEMPIVQAIVSGKTPYMLLKRFDVEHPFPERILFKALFGTYETFLGDVLIFERRDIIVQ